MQQTAACESETYLLCLPVAENRHHSANGAVEGRADLGCTVVTARETDAVARIVAV